MLSRRIFAACVLGLGLTSGVHAECARSYVIQPGDTLTQIARDTLGSVFEFTQIHELNRAVIGENPHRIVAGDTLEIPCRTALEDLNWSVMPNASELAQLRDFETVQILDIRSGKAVKKGTLAGAIHVPYKTWRGPKTKTNDVPSEAHLAEVIGAAGLRLDQPIVLLHSKPSPMDIGRAAYVYWLLKSSGAEQLAILRGGASALKTLGLEMTDAPITPEPYITSVSFAQTWRAESLDVYGIATQQVPGLLVDARPHSIVSRVDKLGQALATTLPGARNAPIDLLVKNLKGEVSVEDGAESIVAHLKEHQSHLNDGMVISFCSSGELAALNWFYASEIAGVPSFRLYPESVKGWKADGGKLFAADTLVERVHAVLK